MNAIVEVDNKYINRELSWLEFNQRVLDRARCSETPLLERLKFLAITGSNLDEFFMVRVGGLKIQSKLNPDKTDIVGLSPDEQLSRIRQRVSDFCTDQYACMNTELLPALAEHGIKRLGRNEISPPQLEHLRRIFEEEILSVISPIAVRCAEDFPIMVGAPLAVCIRLTGRSLVTGLQAESDQSTSRFVVLPLAKNLPRILNVPSDHGFQFVLLEDVVSMLIGSVLSDQTVEECVAFRALRNADVTVDEEGADDLLADMQAMIDERAISDCVRLEIAADVSNETRSFLQSCLDTHDDDVYLMQGPLDVSAFMSLAAIQGFSNLKFEPWPPQPSPWYSPGDDIFEVIANRDRLLIHPYQAYDPVVDFVRAAARDPKVIAIKQTLYRTSRDSQIVEALREAAESGKHVTVIVELKARFDEKRNIGWARQLEKAGVDVIYGVRGLKTHAKLLLVIRRESTGIRRYMHIGTGNYNESTARLYSDVSFLTCDPQIGTDAVNLYNAITGLSIPQTMQKLVAAPIDLRNRLLELIEVETLNAKNRRPALIQAKTNSLVDKKIIDALYEASQAGVKIDLNVRGICCLLPGVEGVSDNIRVTSIIDRFLEHARIFYFLHGGDHRVFVSSADWMGRNLDRRIELMAPIEDSSCKKGLIETLGSYFSDNVSAQRLLDDGSYVPVDAENQLPHRSQQHLYTVACEMHQAQKHSSRTVFQPHRANTESA